MVKSAIKNNDLNFVKNNIELCVNYKDELNGNTALHLVGCDKITKLLIDGKADVDAKNIRLCTPLHSVKSPEIGKLLLENKADINDKDKIDKTPLNQAKRLNIVKFLIESKADIFGEKRTPLHGCVNVEIAEFFLIHIDVDSKDYRGRTPLQCTSSYEVAKTLIKRGADVNNKSEYERTPLFDAEYPKIAKLLIENGADINFRDRRGSSVLHKSHRLRTKKFLIDQGFDVNTKDNNGRTPLHCASLCEMGAILIENGADIDCETTSKETPFDIYENKWRRYGVGIKKNFRDLMMLLILSGSERRNRSIRKEEYADIIDKVMKYGFSSFNFVCQENEDEIEKCLKSKLKNNLDAIINITHLSSTNSSVILRCLTPNSPFII